MRLYIAADYDRREEAQEVAAVLRGDGHEITATWLEGDNEETYAHTPEDEASWAARDIQDIQRAEGLVVLTAPRNKPDHAGHHFEAGYCHAHRMPIFVLGPVPTCFYSLFWGADDVETLRDLIANPPEDPDTSARKRQEAAALQRLNFETAAKKRAARNQLARFRAEPEDVY